MTLQEAINQSKRGNAIAWIPKGKVIVRYFPNTTLEERYEINIWKRRPPYTGPYEPVEDYAAKDTDEIRLTLTLEHLIPFDKLDWEPFD